MNLNPSLGFYSLRGLRPITFWAFINGPRSLENIHMTRWVITDWLVWVFNYITLRLKILNYYKIFLFLKKNRFSFRLRFSLIQSNGEEDWIGDPSFSTSYKTMQMSAAVSTTTAHLWPPLFLPICNNKLGGERSMNFFCCRNGPVRFPHLQKVSAQKQPENVRDFFVFVLFIIDLVRIFMIMFKTLGKRPMANPVKLKPQTFLHYNAGKPHFYLIHFSTSKLIMLIPT